MNKKIKVPRFSLQEVKLIFLPSEHKKVINCLEMTKSSKSPCTIIARERHALLEQNLGRRSCKIHQKQIS